MVPLAILAGPTFAVKVNSTFEINITFHNPFKSQDAHDLILSVEYPGQYILPPDNFTFLFSNGDSGIDGELRIL